MNLWEEGERGRWRRSVGGLPCGKDLADGAERGRLQPCGMSVKGSNLWRKVSLPRRKEGRGGGGVRTVRCRSRGRVHGAWGATNGSQERRRRRIEVTTQKMPPEAPRAGRLYKVLGAFRGRCPLFRHIHTSTVQGCRCQAFRCSGVLRATSARSPPDESRRVPAHQQGPRTPQRGTSPLQHRDRIVSKAAFTRRALIGGATPLTNYL